MAKKISELPERQFTSKDIDHCFYVQDMHTPIMSYVKMSNVFKWIKEEAEKNGLTIEMTDERIMFISGNAT